MADQIIVPASPTPTQIAAGLRQVATILGTVLGTLGLFPGLLAILNKAVDPQFAGIVGVVATVVAVVWGQLSTRAQAKKLAVTAEAAPNAVAKVEK